MVESLEPKTKKRFCEHCKTYLSIRVYKNHEAEFYSKESGKWTVHSEDLYEKLDTVDDDILINAVSSIATLEGIFTF